MLGGQLSYTLAMKKIGIKQFKTTPDLAKMIEEGHKVHAMANGRIQSYERHTPQPEDYSNLDDFMEVAENHIDELFSTRREVDEMLTEVFTVFVRHPELSGTPYIAVLELMVFLEEDFRQLTKRYEAVRLRRYGYLCRRTRRKNNAGCFRTIKEIWSINQRRRRP